MGGQQEASQADSCFCVHRLGRYFLFEHSEPHHLSSMNQPISLRLQGVPERSFLTHPCVHEIGECNVDERGKQPKREACGSISAAVSGPVSASLLSPVIKGEETWAGKWTVEKGRPCEETVGKQM